MRRPLGLLVALLLFPLVLPAQVKGKATSSPGKALALSELRQPVTILRDRWGVAHIYAQNQHDLFFAQGYNAASDRLFQIEMWKRSGQGRLAEVLGRRAIERDRFARLLRYRGDMKAEYESYAPDAKEILEDFVSGINAYIREALADRAKLPPEFKAAGFLPEEWRPQDCLNRLSAFSMTTNAKNELRNAELVRELGPETAAALRAFDPPAKLDVAPGLDLSDLSAGLLKDLRGSDELDIFPKDGKEEKLPPAGKQGSNNWALSGGMTASGKPLLANDPHRNLNLPSLRYLVHLSAPGWDVIGAGEPGQPGVAIGHNRDIAWGLTIFYVDQQDLYLEQLNDKDPTQYRTESGWEPMRIEREIIFLKGGIEVEVQLKFTRHGPVLWEDRESHRALALRWSGAEPGAAGYLASLSLDRARNWPEFLAAMRRWKLPPENMIYADRAGNIGQQSMGLVPIRKNFNGLLPVPGVGGFEWAGFASADQLPRYFNPKSGYVATANDRQPGFDPPFPLGFSWSAFRIERIREVLEAQKRQGKKASAADMSALQNDVTSNVAKRLQRVFRSFETRASSADESMLMDWDGIVSEDSAAASLYEVWHACLGIQVFHTLAPNAPDRLLEMFTEQALVHAVENAAAGKSSKISRDDLFHMLRGCIEPAANFLTKTLGPDRTKWGWGNLHKLKLKHPLTERVGGAWDLPAVGRPGDDETVNAASIGANFEQADGASFREILDLADWDRSLAINTPGQSGRPGSPHYSDLLKMWDEGKYFPLVYSRAAVEKAAESRAELVPAAK